LIRKMLANVREHFDSLPTWAKVSIGVAAVATPVVIYMRCPRKSPLKKDWQKDMVYVYQFPRTPYIPNISPFCLKLETWLRMASINYENVDCSMSTRSKEGTLPFVELNGVEHPDSDLAIRDLSRAFKTDEKLNADLNDEQKAAGRAIERMAEYSVLMSYAYIRYTKPQHIQKLLSKEVMGRSLPLFMVLMKPLFPRMIRKRFYQIGIGRHDEVDIEDIGLRDIQYLSKYLGGKKFFLGDKPHQVDATVFSVLAQIVYLPLDTPHKALIQGQCKNLMQWCNLMKTTLWPDWEEAGRTMARNTKWKKP